MNLSLDLLSTLLIWLLFGMIFLSDRRNRLNRICFYSGLLFSLGTFKEFFYYDLGPLLLTGPGGLDPGLLRALYSVMTSVFYLCAMPSALLFALCFCGVMQRRRLRPGPLLVGMALPAGLFLCFFPPAQTYLLQRTSLAFWVSACCYNLAYGALFTFFLLAAVRWEADAQVRRQKRRVALLVLPLIWYWLVTIFVFHTLRFYPLFKLWKGNALLVAGAIAYYLYTAFREGMMGVRLNAEHYQWEAESRAAFWGAQFLGHALRHDLTKLSWCAQNLRQRIAPPPAEAEIIAASARRLQELAGRIALCSGELTVQAGACTVGRLLEECCWEEYRDRARLSLDCGADMQIFCDPRHTGEVLRNLLENACEAAGEGGCAISLTFARSLRVKHKKGRFDRLTLSDQGPGIPQEALGELFFPYRTSKAAQGHLGLGLFYCSRVMQSHGGWIEAENLPAGGCAFQLYFPAVR